MYENNIRKNNKYYIYIVKISNKITIKSINNDQKEINSDNFQIIQNNNNITKYENINKYDQN